MEKRGVVDDIQAARELLHELYYERSYLESQKKPIPRALLDRIQDAEDRVVQMGARGDA